MSISKTKDPLRNVFFGLGTVIFTGTILYVGKPLFIPLSFGLLIAFVLQPFCANLEKRGVHRIISILIGLFLLSFFAGLLVYLMYSQITKFTSEWPLVRDKIIYLVDDVREYLVIHMGVSKEQADYWLHDFLNNTIRNTVHIIETSFVSFVVNIVMIVLIPVYAYLILYYRKQLVELLNGFFSAEKRTRVAEVIDLAIQTYYNFIKGMAVVYLVVGLLNSIGLMLLGIPHAFLFGFLTAIMTFIPYVGIIVASLLPISYAWITHGSVWYPLGVVAVFTFVQYLEANVIFPWAVSHRLQLNTLVTLAIIIVGGIIWGAAGMILFIPFAGLLKLIADKMEGWEQVSKFLGK